MNRQGNFALVSSIALRLWGSTGRSTPFQEGGRETGRDPQMDKEEDPENIPTQREETAMEMTGWHRTHERKTEYFQPTLGGQDLPTFLTRRPLQRGNRRPREWWAALQAEARQPSLCIHVGRASAHGCQTQLLPGLSLAGPLEVTRARWCQAGGGLHGFAKRKLGLAGATKGLSGCFQRLARWLSSTSAGPTLSSQGERSASPFPRSALCLNKKRNGEVANNGSKRKYATSAMDSSTKLATHTSDTQDVFT